MTITNALTIIVTAMLAKNCVAYFGFGNVALGENVKSSTFLLYSCVMFSIATLFSSTISYVLKVNIFVPNNLEDFLVLFEVLLAVLPIFIMGLIVYKRFPQGYFLLKDNTYLITFTVAVLGSVIFVMEMSTSILSALLYAVGTVLGFILVNVILYSFSGYARRNVEGFTPYLVNLLTIAVISLLLMSFSSIM